MPEASDFFGMDFGVAKPVPTEQVADAPKKESTLVSALQFFGMDFSAPKQVPVNEVAPRSSGNSKFETVFGRLTKQESGDTHMDASGKLISSVKGAKGITQVMPNTGDDPGFGVAPLKNKTKAEYLRFGRDYLQAMVTEFGGDYEKALAAYNAGVGNVKNAVEKGGANWKDYLPKKSETLPYIERILGKGK
jgi:hypothetical protein